MRIKLKHYSHSFCEPSSGLYIQSCGVGHSNTDLTFYRPDVSVSRAIIEGLQGAGLKKGLYDFPDGVDTGERISLYLRNKGRDLAEVEAIERAVSEDIQAKSQIDKENLEKAIKDVEDLNKVVQDSKIDSSSTSSQ